MNKKHLILFLILLMILPLKVFAQGGFSTSTSSITMYVGDTKTISVTSNNAVGKLNISSANTKIATVNKGSIFIQTPGSSESITITAKSVGTTKISVVGSDQFATMDEEILSGVTKTITVKVIEKTSSNTSKSNTKSNTSNKSTNNKLKTITIDGYNLIKTDDNNYKLTVSNDVTSLVIKATAEDSKAQVSGTGSHEIKVGENKIEVTITSESGSKNIINVVITRKDGYYLEDMSKLLEDSSQNNINIIIDKDSSLTNDDLNKIKNSNKIINFNYYDENKTLKYSWTIDGAKIKDINELSLEITNTTDNQDKILKLSNYASGILLSFKNNNNLPEETKIKFLVGENYNNGDILNLYYYDQTNNKLELVNDNLIVTDNYVEFEIEHSSDYFLTMSKITEENNSLINIYMIISIIEFILLIIVVLCKRNKVVKFNNGINSSNIKFTKLIKVTLIIGFVLLLIGLALTIMNIFNIAI